MSAWLLGFVALIYLWVAIDHMFIRNDPGMALAWLAYSIANVGFIIHGNK